MPISQTVLWVAIAVYEPCPEDARLRFSDRLAQENGWDRGYARRALAEYRRFVYLARISPEIVTPSDTVDQVWHLHLTYTHDYWGRFCPEVLGRELHHGPTQGGGLERARYLRAYENTLSLYRHEFDVAAPVDIWPAPQVRFANPQRFKRIDTSRFILLPKLPAMAWGAIGVGLMLSGCQVFNGTITDVILPLLFGLIVIVIIAIYQHFKGAKKSDSGCGSSCSSGSSDSGHYHSNSGDDSSGGDGGGGDSGCGGGCGGGGD